LQREHLRDIIYKSKERTLNSILLKVILNIVYFLYSMICLNSDQQLSHSTAAPYTVPATRISMTILE